MKPTVLLYNFTDSKRKMKVQQALMPLGFRLRAVPKEEYGLPVGVLAGVKGLNEDVLKEAGQAIEAGEETQKEESAQKQADGRLQREVPENDSSRKMDFSDEMAIMAGFSSAQIDAFIHAEEAYVSTAASPFSDALAEKAMALIGKNIRRFVANRNDIEAAEAMMTGSLFAGIAFSFARLGNVHAMSHPVSAFFDVPHGVANAVLLPVIAEYNALADHGKYLTIYNDISPIPAYADEFEPMMLVDAIRELCTDIGIPENLTIAINNASKTGTVTKEEIESRIEPMAVDAMKSGNIAVNPRASRQCDIEMLYRRAL